jgi:hypothetical protein
MPARQGASPARVSRVVGHSPSELTRRPGPDRQSTVARGLTRHELAAKIGSGVPYPSARLWLGAVLELQPVEE